VAINLNNKGNTGYYARLIRRGVPLEGAETESSRNIQMELRYRDMAGNPVDPARLPQGTNFMAEVSLFNPGLRGDYEELALSQIFPSGWEIVNTRLDGTQSDPAGAKYADIRDDRVHHYFDLRKNERKTFRVPLIAAYRGRFYLPATVVEAMYDDGIYANSRGMWVEVVSDK
jgi:alpha-2-macroglobulin